MAAAASNKTRRKDLRYPELEEQALQYILDSCESSISKYSKFLQVTLFPVQFYKWGCVLYVIYCTKHSLLGQKVENECEQSGSESSVTS